MFPLFFLLFRLDWKVWFQCKIDELPGPNQCRHNTCNSTQKDPKPGIKPATFLLMQQCIQLNPGSWGPNSVYSTLHQKAKWVQMTDAQNTTLFLIPTPWKLGQMKFLTGNIRATTCKAQNLELWSSFHPVSSVGTKSGRIACVLEEGEIIFLDLIKHTLKKLPSHIMKFHVKPSCWRQRRNRMRHSKF